MSTFINNVINNPVAWIALIVSVVSVIFTIWKIRRDLTRQNSRDYLDAATRLLERAYETFDKSRNGKWSNLPQPSRLLWLTVARMIKEAESTAKDIEESSHKVLYDHARNFWRGRLYDLLLPLETISLRYFAEDADSLITVIGENTRMPLAEKSLRVILDFLEWPATKKDPLEGIKDYTDAEIDRMRSFRYRPVADFLEAQNAMTGPNENMKKHWRDTWAKASPE